MGSSGDANGGGEGLCRAVGGEVTIGGVGGGVVSGVDGEFFFGGGEGLFFLYKTFGGGYGVWIEVFRRRWASKNGWYDMHKGGAILSFIVTLCGEGWRWGGRGAYADFIPGSGGLPHVFLHQTGVGVENWYVYLGLLNTKAG